MPSAKWLHYEAWGMEQTRSYFPCLLIVGNWEYTWLECCPSTLIIERSDIKSSSDDHSYLDYLETPLSCIAQLVSDIGKITVKFPFARMNNSDKENLPGPSQTGN